MKPKKFSEKEIQALIDDAKLNHAGHAWGRGGPLWGTFVYFYTDYENDKVRINPFTLVENYFISGLS